MCRLFLSGLLLLGVPAFAAAAAIEGRVALPKTRSQPVVNQRYEVVNRAGVLSMNPPAAIIYLEGNFPVTTPATYQIAQKDMAFVPMLLAVPAGSRVEFPNLDDTYHNIFSFSAAKRFDLGRYRPDERPIPSVVFDTPGLVVLRCDIHEHMRGLILVLATPHSVQTDLTGSYRLDGLPAGRFVLKVWVDSRTTLSRDVVLQDGETLRVDFP